MSFDGKLKSEKQYKDGYYRNGWFRFIYDNYKILRIFELLMNIKYFRVWQKEES